MKQKGVEGFSVEWEVMPKISEFFGISIFMFYRYHHPAHFHVLYGGQEVTVSLESAEVLSGLMSPRALGLVREWARERGDKLQGNWEKARNHQPLDWIEPLA